MSFELPPLPYPYDGLEPHIDEETMHIHHDRHHAAYVNNLNTALEGHSDLQGKSIDDLLRNISSVPETIRTAVRNNGGGHANHSLFWTIMKPRGGGEPTGALRSAIETRWGSLDAFRGAFTKASMGRFGSGWAWLVVTSEGELDITSTANQDSPYMDGLTPIMGNDVWEHAYYLKYQNKRADYAAAWWNTLNWSEIGSLYERAKG